MGKTCKRQEKPHSKCEANNEIKKLPGGTTSRELFYLSREDSHFYMSAFADQNHAPRLTCVRLEIQNDFLQEYILQDEQHCKNIHEQADLLLFRITCNHV